MKQSYSRTYYRSRSSIYHVYTNVIVEKMTFDRNPWKRSRPMQSIYDFFVGKYTQFQKRLQIDAKSTQDTDNCKWLGKRNQKNRHTADIVRLSTMKSHASYDYNFPRIPWESSQSERRLLVHHIDLFDSLRHWYEITHNQFRDCDDELSKRLRKTHFWPIFDVETFESKKYTHIKICSSRQSEFTWHFCDRSHLLTFKWDGISITSKSYCDKVTLHYRNNDDKKKDYRPYHERQNETVSCVQVIKVWEKLDVVRRACRIKISWSSQQRLKKKQWYTSRCTRICVFRHFDTVKKTLSLIFWNNWKISNLDSVSCPRLSSRSQDGLKSTGPYLTSSLQEWRVLVPSSKSWGQRHLWSVTGGDSTSPNPTCPKLQRRTLRETQVVKDVEDAT